MTDQQFLAVIGYLEGAYRIAFKPNEVQVWRVECDGFDPETLLQAAREYVDAGHRYPPTLGDLKPIARRLQAAQHVRLESARRLVQLRALPGPSRLPARRSDESAVAYLERLVAEGIA